MSDNLTGSKIYLLPEHIIFDAVTDLAGMQGAKITLSSTVEGKICFFADLYGEMREYRFFIINIGKKRCNVRLEIVDPEADRPDKKAMIKRQFALLDSMLIINVETAFEG